MATGWGPYFDAMFAPARVTAWINFKRMSTGVNIARRLWDRREELRQEYCDICWRLRSDDLPARHQLTAIAAAEAMLVFTACRVDADPADRTGRVFCRKPWPGNSR